MKKLILLNILLLLVINILFISCPFMERLYTPINYLDFELSEQNIKTNTPIELAVTRKLYFYRVISIFIECL